MSLSADTHDSDLARDGQSRPVFTPSSTTPISRLPDPPHTLRPLPTSATTSTSTTAVRPVNRTGENSFLLSCPSRVALPASNEITPHPAPPSRPPATLVVVPAEGIRVESQEEEDDTLRLRERLLMKVNHAYRSYSDPSVPVDRRVMKIPRVRKHYSSSARRERKFRLRSRSSETGHPNSTEEACPREERCGGREHGPVPREAQGGEGMEEEEEQRFRGYYGEKPVSSLPADVPGIRVENTEGGLITLSETGSDAGWMDWCQQTPPSRAPPSYVEESCMDWSKNSPPAPPPPPQSNAY